MDKKTAIIIGGGPAGLTAAYELLHKSDIKPIVLEQSNMLGGISKTANHKGNRLDIGGHRFFSKSDRVMQWWQNILPIQGSMIKEDSELDITYRKQSRKVLLQKDGPDPNKEDRVMLIRSRLSRIFFLRSFFDYPVKLNFNTIKNLGLWRITKIMFSYLGIKIVPIRKEKSLEDFFINRFGKELYITFFRDYTEKVWGVPCHEIKPEWGAQRIKGLSVSKALWNAVKKIFVKEKNIDQKGTETSLIEQFMYPKLGPGHMWEETGRIILEKGGEIRYNHRVKGIRKEGNRIVALSVENTETGQTSEITGDFFFSTMAVKDLVGGMNDVPDEVRKVSDGLVYRDFMTVGLLLNKLKIKNKTEIKTRNNLIPDNWIYVQEKEVKLGRIQVINNWSPFMLADLDKVWLGLEYFVNKGDELWSKSDEEFAQFAIDELAQIDIIDKEDALEAKVIREEKTYPAYFGTYDDFGTVRRFTDQIENLFLVGRNGMHKYNNMDHSMLAAMTAVENIINGVKTKDNIWDINTEKEYHEEKDT